MFGWIVLRLVTSRDSFVVKAENPSNETKHCLLGICLGFGDNQTSSDDTVGGSEIPFPTTWDGAKTL